MFKDYTSEQAQEGHYPDLSTVHPSPDPSAWPHALAAQAASVFESLPDQFTFDALLEAGASLGHSPQRTTEYLRTYERLDMADVEGDVIHKTGPMPYF